MVNRPYCEILRDRIVREVKTGAASNRYFSVASSASSHIDKVLSELPGLGEPAQRFYLSEEYAGGMDTNLVVAGLVLSLLHKDYAETERFKLMLEVLYPEVELVDAGKYLRPCRKCGATGLIDLDCRSCEGTGKCSRCDGTGERTLEINKDRIYCTTCRGTGKCAECRGKGVLQFKCKACGGYGRVLQRQRSEIKLVILVERLEEFRVIGKVLAAPQVPTAGTVLRRMAQTIQRQGAVHRGL